MRIQRLALLLNTCLAATALGQSSSLLMAPTPHRPATGAVSVGASGANGYAAMDGAAGPGQAMFIASDPKDEDVLPMTRAIEASSLYAIPVQVPRKFKVEDLVTIIVRQQKKYEGEAELETKKNWGISGKLSDWFRFYDDCAHLGQDKLSNGEPGFKFNFGNNYKTEGESDREDRFTTRLTARIIDVKPNGNLVLEAMLEQEHDEERSTVTVTGICRSTDVTPDNTVLSTQIAELRIVEKNRGAIRDATTRGWVPRILDYKGGAF